MLRFCGNLASSSARAILRRNFATTAVRRNEFENDQRDVDKLFNADQNQGTRRRHGFSLNRIELLGGVGDDPVTRVSRNGSEYTTFNLFTNVDFRKGDGSYGEQTEMHQIHAFANQANFIKSNITKGSRVMIIGRLHYDGGVVRPDGTRSPRNASVTADHIFPINRPQRDNDFNQ